MNPEKIWYLAIRSKQQGPFSIEELRVHPELTPDTYVWRSGWEEWKRLREVPELRDLFKDRPHYRKKGGPLEVKRENIPEDEVLTIRKDPSQWLLWLILILLVIAYVWWQME